jgi:hypothetical protein
MAVKRSTRLLSVLCQQALVILCSCSHHQARMTPASKVNIWVCLRHPLNIPLSLSPSLPPSLHPSIHAFSFFLFSNPCLVAAEAVPCNECLQRLDDGMLYSSLPLTLRETLTYSASGARGEGQGSIRILFSYDRPFGSGSGACVVVVVVIVNLDLEIDCKMRVERSREVCTKFPMPDGHLHQLRNQGRILFVAQEEPKGHHHHHTWSRLRYMLRLRHRYRFSVEARHGLAGKLLAHGPKPRDLGSGLSVWRACMIALPPYACLLIRSSRSLCFQKA